MEASLPSSLILKIDLPNRRDDVSETGRREVEFYTRLASMTSARFSLLWHLITPVWQAAMDLPPMIWWGHLERIMLALDDLGCRDLLF